MKVHAKHTALSTTRGPELVRVAPRLHDIIDARGAVLVRTVHVATAVFVNDDAAGGAGPTGSGRRVLHRSEPITTITEPVMATALHI